MASDKRITNLTPEPWRAKGRRQMVLSEDVYTEVFSPGIVISSPEPEDGVDGVAPCSRGREESPLFNTAWTRQADVPDSLETSGGVEVKGEPDSLVPPSGCRLKVPSSLTNMPASWKIQCTEEPTRKNEAIVLKNYATNKTLFDTLHLGAERAIPCTVKTCQGSVVQPNHDPSSDLFNDQSVLKARAFLKEYYHAVNKHSSRELVRRTHAVTAEMSTTNSFQLTYEELHFAAKYAWRNATRCSGRSFWTTLRLIDGRNITSVKEMFDVLCQHLRYATNNGNIRSTMTVFEAQKGDTIPFRIWNTQLIQYAGYKQVDGTVIGDPSSVEFTQVCMSLGWKGRMGRFDVLPWVLQKGTEEPEVYEIPLDLVLEVNIRHPKNPGLASLGLKWYAVPAVTFVGMEVGGILFPTCAFNGWYMTDEIAVRDLCDEQRYNLVEEVARVLDIGREWEGMWQCKAAVELNIAVEHSFQTDGVTIMNSHVLSEAFQHHFIKEHQVRGGCPSDWVWIVPPISGSLTSLFHQEMLNYQLTPNFYYRQEDPWKGYVRVSIKDKRPTPLPHLKTVAWALRFLVRTMRSILSHRPKVTVLYGSETGTAEKFAHDLGDAYRNAFDVRVINMADYNVSDLKEERLVLYVASTTGNGSPPFCARAFSEKLVSLASESDSRRRSSVSLEILQKMTIDQPGMEKKKPLTRVRFAVFALGSRAYPKFCAFGKFLDWLMNLLGAQRIHSLVKGDEMCAQRQTFNKWTHSAFRVLCEVCNVRQEVILEALTYIPVLSNKWETGKLRLIEEDVHHSNKQFLEKVYGETIHTTTLLERQLLIDEPPMRKTLLIKLRDEESISYVPGDHVLVFPEQSVKLVEEVMGRIEKPFPVDKVFSLQYLRKNKSHIASVETWATVEHLPSSVSLRQALTSLLDITQTPSQTFLAGMVAFATDDAEAYMLKQLSEETIDYDQWVDRNRYNLAETLAEFASVCLPAIFLLSQLPLLQPRAYSVSSCPETNPGEVHLTMSLTKYYTTGAHRRIRVGLCTGWLEQLAIGSEVFCYVRKNPTFYMPISPSIPLILVASGTGMAPYRSFWQKRLHDLEHTARKRRPLDLYYGCRTKSDFLFYEEIEQAVRDKALGEVHLATSRETSSPKRYVQEVLLEKGRNVADLVLNKRACIYVCGHVMLNEGVEAALVNILMCEGKMSNKEAKDFILDMKEYGRYNEDIFGATRDTLRDFRPSLSCSSEVVLDKV